MAMDKRVRNEIKTVRTQWRSQFKSAVNFFDFSDDQSRVLNCEVHRNVSILSVLVYAAPAAH
eukprot:2434210-Pleurochrysis_carterae.AAC.1